MEEQNLTEEDTKLRYINPAILAKWNPDRIEMEHHINDGRIELQNGRIRRSSNRCKPDYILRSFNGFPLAVVEAKKAILDMAEGMSQGESYALKLDAPFAYATNGKGFREYDFLTGKYRDLRMDEFPSEVELRERYLREGQISASNPRFAPFYYGNLCSKSPRYYQRIAVDRTVEAIYNGRKRMMIVLATGTGKTFIAMQILYKLMDATKTVKRALFLVDRNALADQPLTHDFKPIAKSCNKITKGVMDTAHPIQIALYQQLSNTARDDGDDDDFEMPYKDYPPDYFDLIIVDECHRGSASEDSKWREILEYFKDAAQVGMTATPKEDREASNSQYFGEPLYMYSYRSGVEDGFLAPFYLINKFSNIEHGLPEGVVDREGNPVDSDVGTKDYDRRVVVESRSRWVAREIVEYMKETGDMYAKTIVFCEDTYAAEMMREHIRELVPDLVKEDPRYVMRITGNDKEGKGQLPNFNATGERYPVIATTSELMTTGVDSVMCKIIAINKNIASLTEFRQILGRGSRISEPNGKLAFTLLDFKNVSQLFRLNDDWDGVSLPYEGPTGKGVGGGGGEGTGEGGGGHGGYGKIYVDQKIDVHTDIEVESVYTADGISLQDVRMRSKNIILGEYASLDSFLHAWSEEHRKSAIVERLESKGLDLEYLRDELGYGDLDSFDIILNLAYSKEPMSKTDRARNVLNDPILKELSDKAREVIMELMEVYRNTTQEDLTNLEILSLKQFERFGSRTRIVGEFGGKAGYLDVVRRLESVLYS